MQVLLFVILTITLTVVAARDPRCPLQADNDTVIFYPHERNCSQFYVCASNGTLVLNECSEGLEFDEEVNVCNWARGDCDIARLNPLRTVSSFNCKADDEGLYFANFDNNCQSYFKCENGVAHEARCATGLVFNPLTRACDIPSMSKCAKPKTTEYILPDCSRFRDGTVFPNYGTSCQSFYICNQGKHLDAWCTDDKIFNPVSGLCDRPENTRCVCEGDCFGRWTQPPCDDCIEGHPDPFPPCIPPDCPTQKPPVWCPCPEPCPPDSGCPCPPDRPPTQPPPPPGPIDCPTPAPPVCPPPPNPPTCPVPPTCPPILAPPTCPELPPPPTCPAPPYCPAPPPVQTCPTPPPPPVCPPLPPPTSCPEHPTPPPCPILPPPPTCPPLPPVETCPPIPPPPTCPPIPPPVTCPPIVGPPSCPPDPDCPVNKPQCWCPCECPTLITKGVIRVEPDEQASKPESLGQILKHMIDHQRNR